MLFDTSKLESEQAELEDKVNALADDINSAIDENARVALDQEEYEKRYNDLVYVFDVTNNRLEDVKLEITEKQTRRQQMEMFINRLEKTGMVDTFD